VKRNRLGVSDIVMPLRVKNKGTGIRNPCALIGYYGYLQLLMLSGYFFLLSLLVLLLSVSGQSNDTLTM
jgi:hypothetical protein